MNNRTHALAVAMVATMAQLFVGGCGPTQPKPTAKWAGPVPEIPAVPAAKPRPVDVELRERARQEIVAATHAADPLMRAHALEAIRQAWATRADKVDTTAATQEILRGMSDGESVVRFAACMAAGELRLKEAHQALLKMLNDPDRPVQVSVRFALHRLGDTRYSRDLEKFARDPQTVVRADTAMALGLLGDPAAHAERVLKEMRYDGDPIVRLQAAEALWRLRDQEARDDLIATTTTSPYADDKAIAYLALAGPGDTEILPYIRAGMVSPYPQIALIAARSAGMLGSDMGYTLAMRGVTRQDPLQRSLAAFALGAIGRTDSQPILTDLLKDTDPDVRLAAATAVMQLKEGT